MSSSYPHTGLGAGGGKEAHHIYSLVSVYSEAVARGRGSRAADSYLGWVSGNLFFCFHMKYVVPLNFIAGIALYVAFV